MAMTKIYRFTNPYDEKFARACRLGTWLSPPGPGVCPECGVSLEKRIRPLIIEWEPGPTLIGDFSWPGNLDEIVITDRVRKILDNKCRGVEFSEVQIRRVAKIGHKKGNRSHQNPDTNTGLPVALWDMWVTAWCHVDIERSQLVVEQECSTCNARFLKPPTDSQTLFLKKDSWHRETIFKTFEFPGWIFATEAVQNLIVSAQCTNVGFVEVGVIP